MEFTLEAGAFAAAIGLVKGVVPQRTTIPILNNVRVSVDEKGRVSVGASCIDMEAYADARCEVITPGAITIHGQTLFGLAKALPKTKLLTVKIEDGRAHLTCGKSRYNLGTLPAEDFPGMAEDEAEGVTLMFAASDLKSALDATIPTTSTLEDRVYLNGVHVRPEGDDLAFVSSDGHRFVRYRLAAENAGSVPHAIIPTDAAKAISGLCGEAEGNVRVTISTNRVSVLGGNASITSRLINAKFPDYAHRMPNPDGGASVLVSEFSDAVDRLALAYGEMDSKQPLCVASAKNGEIEIRSGRNVRNAGIEVAGAEGDVLFAVSVHYLSEAAKAFPRSAKVLLTAVTPDSPILLTSKDLPNKTYLLMPMSIAGELIHDRIANMAA